MRSANQAKRLTNRSRIAGWIEAETLHLKRLGMGYQAIAEQNLEVPKTLTLLPLQAIVRFPLIPEMLRFPPADAVGAEGNDVDGAAPGV